MNVGLNGRFYAARVTGVQRFAREIARQLVDRVDVTLLLPADGVNPPDIPPEVRRIRGRLRGHVWEQLELPTLRAEAHCDVLLHLSPTAPLWGGPHVMTIHDVFPISNPEWFASGFARWYRMSLGPAARRAAAVIATSQWARQEIVRWLNVPRDRIHVVNHGLAPFDAPSDQEVVKRVKSRFDLHEYVLAVGAGDPRKNLRFLGDVVRLWKTLDDDIPRVVVAGEGLARVHPADAASGGDALSPLGYVSDDDLRALYTGALAFCFPSLGEGFGRPPLEALACGTPVLAAEYGPAREVLGHAAQILPLDARRWVDALRRMRTEKNDEGRRAAARAHIQRFDWNSTAQQVAECCRHAVDTRVGRRRYA